MGESVPGHCTLMGLTLSPVQHFAVVVHERCPLQSDMREDIRVDQDSHLLREFVAFLERFQARVCAFGFPNARFPCPFVRKGGPH